MSQPPERTSSRRRSRRARAGVLGSALLTLFSTTLLSSLLLPVPQPALAQAAAKARTVTVKEGDTLEVIAARHGVSVEALQKLNAITDPRTLQIDQVLKLPPPAKPKPAAAKPSAQPAPKPAAAKPTPKPAAKPATQPSAAQPDPAKPDPVPAAKPEGTTPDPQKPAQGRWRYFGNTLVDWGGWKLHPGGLRVTVVQPASEDVGVVRAKATAVAVQCSTLRQTWRVDGTWQEWTVPEPRSVAQQIVLDLCDDLKEPSESAIPPPAAAPGP